MARGGRQHIPRPPGTTEGPPPPWRESAWRVPDLAAVRRMRPDEDDFGVDRAERQRDAAVLAPFHARDGELVLYLVKRREDSPTHAGEIALPGGIHQPSDPDLVATALREADEEIALAPADVDVVTTLGQLSTYVSRTCVTPVVGVVTGDPVLVPQESEIERVVTVPVDELLAPDVYRSEQWDVPWRDGVVMHFFELEDETLWGLTARIVYRMLVQLTAPS